MSFVRRGLERPAVAVDPETVSVQPFGQNLLTDEGVGDRQRLTAHHTGLFDGGTDFADTDALGGHPNDLKKVDVGLVVAPATTEDVANLNLRSSSSGVVHIYRIPFNDKKSTTIFNITTEIFDLARP